MAEGKRRGVAGRLGDRLPISSEVEAVNPRETVYLYVALEQAGQGQ